jgi:O-antigen/teichoic acid export membrane protein
VAILILDTLVVIPYAYLRVKRRSVKFAFYRIFNITIYALLNVILLWLIPFLIRKNILHQPDFIRQYSAHPKVIYIFIANLTASIFTFLLFIPVLQKFRLGIDKVLLKKMLRYSLPIMIAGLAYATNENLDKLLIGRMLDKEQMGVYAAVYKLGVLMLLYVTAFRLGAEPYFFSQHKAENAKQQYATILLWFTIFGAVFLVGIMTFLDIISGLLIGQAVYLKALNIVPVILTAYLMFGIYNNLSVWYKLTDQTRYGMYLSVFGALITIVINVLMIPKVGYMASAWATLAAYGGMSVFSYILGRKHYPVPYQTFKIVFYVISPAITGWLIYRYFYDNYPVKILILILYIGMVYISERKNINRLFNKKTVS